MEAGPIIYTSKRDKYTFLGGLFTTIPSGADANDYRESGKYYIGQGITNIPTLEEPIRCILIVEEHSSYVTQTLYDVVYAHNRVFQRCCDFGTWSSWAEISFNIPSFYQNYADLSSLANALGVNDLISKTPIHLNDYNDVHASGIYSGHNVSNQPFEYSVVLVINYSGIECVQLGFDILGGSLKERVYVNGAWTSWIVRWQ